jgi:hypothetical protein
MTPSTLADGTASSPCADCYRALYDSCRSGAIASWPAERQESEFARLVSDFALCARGARLRSERVLADIRLALAPVADRAQVSVPTLIERAIADYYQSRWL